MEKMIFVNLPVSDVEASARFYEAVGATRDPRFCQEGVTASMRFSDTIVFVLLSHARFADFTPLRIIDACTQVQALLAMSEDSREALDATMARALAAGATPDPTPPQDMGDFMYGRSFADPDGHIIELMWMDVDKAMAAFASEEGAAA